MHMAAGMALFPTDAPTVVKLLAWSALLVSLMICLSQVEPREIVLDADGGARILDRRGECVAARVDPGTTVFSWLIVLLVLTERGRRAVVLLPDSLSREEYRKLRAWLKWQASVVAG